MERGSSAQERGDDLRTCGTEWGKGQDIPPVDFRQ